MRKFKKVKNKGIVFWITGLSDSGKTQIGKKVKKDIIKNYGPTILFSGDDIRNIFDLKKYTFKDTLFYSVFLTRQETGHTFSAGSTNLNWEAGDVYEMPYYCNHATSNAGFVPKMLVQCLGIKK